MQRSQYKNKYAIGFQNSIDVAVTCSAGIFQNVDAQFTVKDQPTSINKSTGNAFISNGVEIIDTYKVPNIDLQVVMIPKQLYGIFHLFFQDGSLQLTSTASTKWFYPYSSGVCEIYGTIVKDTSTTENSSMRYLGSVVERLVFYCNNNDYMITQASFLARDCEYKHDPSSDVFTITSDSSLLWRDCITKIGNSYDALEDFDFKDFGLSLENAVVSKKYTSEITQCFILGDFSGKGVFKIPFENSSDNYKKEDFIQKVNDGDIMRVSLYWKSQYAGTAQALSINMLVRIINLSDFNEEEMCLFADFIIVGDDSISSEAGKIVAWNIDAGNDRVVNFTFSGSTTLLGNVFPGDRVVLTDAVAGSTIFYTIENVIDSNTLLLTDSHLAGVGATGVTGFIKRQPISIGLNDEVNRAVS